MLPLTFNVAIRHEHTRRTCLETNASFFLLAALGTAGVNLVHYPGLRIVVGSCQASRSVLRCDGQTNRSSFLPRPLPPAAKSIGTVACNISIWCMLRVSVVSILYGLLWHREYTTPWRDNDHISSKRRMRFNFDAKRGGHIECLRLNGTITLPLSCDIIGQHVKWKCIIAI